MAVDDYFNILAIDGGGIKGVITVTCVKRMEEFAFQYANQNYPTKLPKYLDDDGNRIERVPMKDIFNMFSGTSTGSIMSSGFSLTYKNGNLMYPKYWAEDIRNVYIDNAPVIFKKNFLKRFWNFLIYLLYFVIFGVTFYFAGYYRYDNPKIKEAQ